MRVPSAELEEREREPRVTEQLSDVVPSTTPLIIAWWYLHFKALGAQVPMGPDMSASSAAWV